MLRADHVIDLVVKMTIFDDQIVSRNNNTSKTNQII